MARVYSAGKVVMLTITGRVAKKKDGRVTGDWINFHSGDVGAIVEVKKRNRRQPVLSIKLNDGIVDLLPQNVDVVKGEMDV